MPVTVPVVKIDVSLGSNLEESAGLAAALADAGIDGGFTFEGNSDVFFPLVTAADSGLDLYTNVAIAFPRSPMHLAYQAWDLQRASGGRFSLGLGTQIQAHIERRYSAIWDRPVGRMVALITALRDIWANWSDGTPLDHHSDFFRFDLMTPLFVPPPLDGPPPMIWAGALGPQMTRAMASHADGIIIHPFNTGAFLRAVTLPKIAEGREGQSRPFILNVGCIAVPSLTDEDYHRATESIRANLAFYASTPAYRLTLDHHGLGDLQPRLREMTKTGQWNRLAELIDDETLDLLAVRGTPDHCGQRLVAEYGDLADRLSLTTHGASVEALAAMAETISAAGD